MREWHLKHGDPLSLTLAADVRLGVTQYHDDQIWELSLGGGEPPALALQTTFGLRARVFRIFLRFTEGEETRTDPVTFTNPPVLTHIFPNFIALNISPFPDIDVKCEYWVPESQSVGGRIQVTNTSQLPRQIRLELAGQLTSNAGQRMAPIEIQATQVLSGLTDGLAPVVFLTGGPNPGTGPYPSLTSDFDLPPGISRQITWTHAGLASPEESFDRARTIASRKWSAERAHLELLNASQVDIYTGEIEWDVAFSLTQKQALNLFLSPTPQLPQPSFVYSRQPDQGFSLRGDGSDYNHLWNGQSPLEAYYLASLILPAAPDLARELLLNFLSLQLEEGFIDWKPGLAGQRSRLMATPILSNLTWRIFEYTEDLTLLEKAFPSLLKFVHAWFDPVRDRDRDGVPEWDHPMQSGSEDHPLFSRWHKWAQGAEIETAESPVLCAFLFQECQSLIRMARLLNQIEPIPELEALAAHLQTAVETSWDPADGSFHHWDRDTHKTTRGEWLGQRQGPGKITIQREFNDPVRILLRVETSGESTRHPKVFVHGTSASGLHRVESFPDDRIKWYLGIGNLTSDRVYSSIEELEIQGISPDDQVDLFSVNYYNHDITLLIPLWAGMLSEKRALELVQKTVTAPTKYWRGFGMPFSPATFLDPVTDLCQAVNLLWNSMIGEGLVRYGFRAEAADLVTRLMSGTILNLKRDACFRRYFNCDSGQGFGERNALHGLAPLHLFLETLGVRLISSQRVAISGFNPFPWPVTVKYRGMTILRQKEKSTVIFPDGQTVEVLDPAPRIISLNFEHI